MNITYFNIQEAGEAKKSYSAVLRVQLQLSKPTRPEQNSSLNSMRYSSGNRAEPSLTKDTVYRAKCIDKVLSKHSGLDVMLGLADIAYDIFLISLKEENKKLTTRQMRRIIKELSRWKEARSRT